MPIISDDVSCTIKKNISSRNHNLCIKHYFYNPSEIIIYIFSRYFVKSNAKFKMCVHTIVFYWHTGSKRGGGTCYMVQFILKIQLSRLQIQNPFLTAQSTQIKSVISVPIKDFIHHYPRALFNDIPRVGAHFYDIPRSGRILTTYPGQIIKTTTLIDRYTQLARRERWCGL